MGTLHYANDPAGFEIPDRLLAHVKVVATTKLRRGESFLLSWTHTAGASAGRTSLWVHPAIPLQFVFETAEVEFLNPLELRDMAEKASSSIGLVIDLDAVIADAPPVTRAPAHEPARAARFARAA